MITLGNPFILLPHFLFNLIYGFQYSCLYRPYWHTHARKRSLYALAAYGPHFQRKTSTPNRFSVDNVDLMHTMTVSLRDGADRGYIGNYMGAYIQSVGKREGNGSLDALQQIGYIKPYRLPLYIGTHIVSDRKKVHNMAFKLWIAYRLESIREAVTLTLTNTITGSIQTLFPLPFSLPQTRR